MMKTTMNDDKSTIQWIIHTDDDDDQLQFADDHRIGSIIIVDGI